MESRIFFSRILSQIGDMVFNTLFDLWILNIYGSSEILGISLAIASSANFIASFIGGYLADSNYCNIYIIISEFLSFIVSIANIFFLNYSGSSKPSLLIINIFLFILNFNGFLLSPLIKKAISNYVQISHIQKFNQKISVTGQIINTVIPAISTSLYAKKVLSMEGALLINAISFLLAAFALLKILKNKVSSKDSNNKYLDAIKYVKKNYKLIVIIILGAFLSLFASELNVFFPVFVAKILKMQALYGTVIGFQAIGGIAGAVSLKFIHVSKNFKSELPFLIFLLLVLFITVILKNIYLVCALSGLSNLVLVRYGVLSQTFIQINVPKKYIGKVFSILFFCLNLVTPIGNYIFGKVLSFSLILSFSFLILTLIFPITTLILNFVRFK